MEKSFLKHTEPPKVSFLIVTHNDERTIERCLKSIVNQIYPNIEIVVVDACSSDSSVKIASKYANKVICLSTNILGNSRQVSVTNSTGDLLAIFDADVIIPRHWVASAVSKFDRGVGIVSAYNVPPADSTIVAHAFFIYWREFYTERIRTGKGPLAGSNCLYLRKAVEAVGGFDVNSHYSEDVDLGSRIQDLGYKVAVLDIPIIHDTMRSLKKYTKNQLWAAKDFSKHGLNRSRLSTKDIVYEHFYLGTRGFLKGVFIEREKSWIVFPLLLLIRVYAYSITFFMKTVTDFE
jgi:cellulose synthase/poly-beta-1,6-N-acetylglucosamine synthase-like glycosyltransferase